ncbi:hypothetical protein PHLGIDRAFT_127500 [Phlebiopsis gigantea 11061_1 CR5-6]|uniref:Nucleolar protein 11 n=1 Tax=Phlebiopsis gigantea (strain 11061_1 CR5-6) TaxID=745531 RepID=A0A0C3PM93_PHLG1|nr:hypothetical protein PHLGIDRAFT_127500 [Phlebiopsis gigantea 11061_1 CR5-6]
MSTSVNEPFLLSTYTVPKRFTRPGFPVANVYATHQYASTSSADGFVTVAAQGDGVNILDLSTLHPVVSHTLGPSTVFSCLPVSRIDKARACTTYAVLEAAQGVRPEDRGKTARMWRDSLAGETNTTTAQVTVKTEAFSHRITQLAVPDELPTNVLLFGPNGEITVADDDLTVQYSHTFEDASEVQKFFIFDRSQATFVPRRSSLKDGAVIVSLVKIAGSSVLRIVGIDANGIKTLADLPIAGSLAVLDATCSSTGFISILELSGNWHSLQIESPDYSTFVLTAPSSPFGLRNLTFVSTSGAESSSPFAHEAAVLSLGSSHVLLAGVTSPPSSEVVLLLWDLQYSVLLASRTLPIPATISRSKKQGLWLQLSGSSRSQQALLVLSSIPASMLLNGDLGSHAASDDSTQRSAVFVVPMTVPPSSSVANALGRASAGEKWLASAASAGTQASAVDFGLNASQTKLLKQMKTAMEQKRPEAADDVFFAWVSQHEGNRSKSRLNAKLPFGYQLAKQVLEILFRIPKNAATDIPYSPKVVRYLMKQRCVSASMVDGGLFAALRLRNDWESLLLSLKTVMDIPEADVIGLLHTSISAPRQKQADDNAMQVDATTPDTFVPSLQTVLALCVTYTMSAPALRLAIRQHLPDAAELTVVLQALHEMVNAWCDEDVLLLPDRTKKDPHGALVPVIEEKQKGALPPLDKVLVFLQTLLDSSFLTFLTYLPSHAILRDILSHLEPELSFTDDVELLRGPLEPFVRAHTKTVHEAAHGAQKPDLKVDWRRRRKEAHEQAGMAVGVYQIEELLL